MVGACHRAVYAVSDFKVVLEYVCIYRNRCDRQPAFSYYGRICACEAPVSGEKADLYLYADIYDGSVSADIDSDVYTACKAESA